MVPLTRLDRIIAGRVDARPLAVLRIVIGVTAALCGVEAWGTLRGIVRADGLRVPFVPGLAPPSVEMLPWFLAIWFALAALLTLGVFTRITGAALALVLSYTVLVDEQTYSNHLYLVAIEVLLLVLGNAGACWSVDAWRRGRIDTVPAWLITLWKLQISIVYFFAGVAKINGEFLGGDVLANYWPTSGWLGFLAGLRTPQVLQPLAWASVAAEFFLAFALWLPAFRRLAVAVGVCLHLGMIVLVSQKDPTGIIVFALATVPPYLLFFDWSAPKTNYENAN